MNILHISDTHFGTEQAPVAEALVKLAHEQVPDLVILSGDITQRALRVEFAAARAFMERLRIPAWLVIPGNHDISLFNMFSRVFAPYADFRRAFGHELEPVFTSPQAIVISVNTTRRYRHIDGEVSAQQIERVAQLLQAASPTQLRIVVTHQPVSVIVEADQKDLLHGREQAIRRWSEAGADLILGGHIHRPYLCALHEQMTDLSARTWVLQAGTALSSRVRHGTSNSINLIRTIDGLTPRQCITERWDYDPVADAFLCNLATTLSY
jgi:3',5'-cyclic AMP phosphodiesterase CpdA